MVRCWLRTRGAAVYLGLLLCLIGTSVAKAGEPVDPLTMSQRIDQMLADRWQASGVRPAPVSGDAEFHRRLHLDLAGRIPSVAETRAFLSDNDPNRRQRLIESLLASPRHATRMATVWSGFLLPEGSQNIRYAPFQTQFRTWLRQQFADNLPYDVTVRELITASGQANLPGPVYYYTALEAKPEQLAASTSRAFLGVQIQCAECHDHPFDHWKQADFWSYAAFFARIGPTTNNRFVGQIADRDEGEVKHPTTGAAVPPRFLNGDLLMEDSARTRRQALADWMTAPANPYFARSTANRVWGMMFGRGLVDPVDDLGDHNRASHPELLDELAAYFVRVDFDLRKLLQTIALTQAYQLSSVTEGDAAVAPELFARLPVRPLSAEQLYDSLELATMRRSAATPVAAFGVAANQGRQAFLNKFQAPTAGAAEYQAGIPQALTLMNGQLVADATDLEKSDLLGALSAPFFHDEQRVETLFLATLSRYPTAAEKLQFVNYATRSSDPKQRRAALSDILWALLNSAEFAMNH